MHAWYSKKDHLINKVEIPVINHGEKTIATFVSDNFDSEYSYDDKLYLGLISLDLEMKKGCYYGWFSQLHCEQTDTYIPVITSNGQKSVATHLSNKPICTYPLEYKDAQYLGMVENIYEF